LIFGARNTYFIPTFIDAGTLAAGVDNAWPPSPIRVALGATLDLNGFNATVGSLAGAGTVSLPSGPTKTLTTGTDNTSTTFSGVLRGSANLAKVGRGTFTLTVPSIQGPVTAINAGGGFMLSVGDMGTPAGRPLALSTINGGLGSDTVTLTPMPSGLEA